MKLRCDQLARHLQQTPAPIYYVCGDEPLQMQECCDAIRACFRREGFSEREVMQVDNHFDWQQLLDSANSMSLFAERKLIELRFNAPKPGDAGSKALQAYCDNLNADTALLISSSKIEKSAQSSKWFKALDSKGVILQVWPIEGRQLLQWLRQRLQQHHLSVDEEALGMIAEKVEGNLLAAAQEIEKLALLATDKTVNAATVSASVADSSRHNVFELVDHALAGQAKQTLRVLNGLRGEGGEPTLILWALSRELRLLSEARFTLDARRQLEAFFSSQRIFDKRKPLIQAAVNRLTSTQLDELLQHCHLIDLGIKGMKKCNVWDELSDLLLAMSGVSLATGSLPGSLPPTR